MIVTITLLYLNRICPTDKLSVEGDRDTVSCILSISGIAVRITVSENVYGQSEIEFIGHV